MDKTIILAFEGLMFCLILAMAVVFASLFPPPFNVITMLMAFGGCAVIGLIIMVIAMDR